MPPIRRDISIAVDSDGLAEDLGDRVRDALGKDAACVESVDIVHQTPCTALPAQALGRLVARGLPAAAPRPGWARRAHHDPGHRLRWWHIRCSM